MSDQFSCLAPLERPPPSHLLSRFLQLHFNILLPVSLFPRFFARATPHLPSGSPTLLLLVFLTSQLSLPLVTPHSSTCSGLPRPCSSVRTASLLLCPSYAVFPCLSDLIHLRVPLLPPYPFSFPFTRVSSTLFTLYQHFSLRRDLHILHLFPSIDQLSIHPLLYNSPSCPVHRRLSLPLSLLLSSLQCFSPHSFHHLRNIFAETDDTAQPEARNSHARARSHLNMFLKDVLLQHGCARTRFGRHLLRHGTITQSESISQILT